MAVSLGITIKQNSQNISTNKSNITVSVYCEWTNGSYNYQTENNIPTATGWLKIDGTQYDFRNTFNDDRTTSGSKTLFTKTVDVEHNVDGKKTVYCSAYFKTGVSSGNITASASKVLTNIPRFATIESAPNFNDEENPTITYSNPAGNNVTSLRACISLDGTADDVAYRDISKTGTSYTFSLTDAERNVLRAATTDANSRTVKFYVRSEIGGEYKGSNLTRTLTIKDPEPTINPTIKDSNSTTITLTGDSSKLVRYYSNATITFAAAAMKKATLTSKKVTCGNKTLTADGTINAVTSNSFVFTATDSRGNTTTKTVKPSFVNYIKATCSLANNMPDGEGNMTVKATGNYFNGSFGAKSNSLNVYYRYKTVGGSYGSWTAMTVTKSGNTYSATANLTGLDYQTSYVVQTYAKDALMTVYSAEKTVKATPVFDWGENDFRFNVPILPEALQISAAGQTDTQLKSIFIGMGAATMKTIVLKQSVVDSLPVGGTWFVKIYKTNDNYGVIHAMRYYDNGATTSPCVEYHRSIYAGTWTGWDKVLTNDCEHTHPHNTSCGGFRFAQSWMGLYDSFENAEAHTSRKGWIGYNDGSILQIRDEGTGGVNLRSAGPVRLVGYNTNSFLATLSDRFRASGDDLYYLGDSSNKWKSVYAVNGTIQTSDRNRKKNIEELGQRYIDLFDRLLPVSFMFNDAESDRVHIGFVSQDVKAAMDEIGLSDLDFAGFCRDVLTEWDEETQTEKDVLDKDGNPVYVYSLRYSEFIALNSKMIQLNRQKIAAQEQEIGELRADLEALKQDVINLMDSSRGG